MSAGDTQPCNLIDFNTLIGKSSEGVIFHRSSANCINAVVKDKFFKLQGRESVNEDPLEVEVLNIQVLNSIKSDIFLRYVGHSLCKMDMDYTLNEKNKTYDGAIAKDTEYKVLITNALGNATGMRAYMANLVTNNKNDKTAATKAFIRQIATLLSQYISIASTIEFVHSDLHLNNILWDGMKLTIIDYGRSSFNNQRAVQYGMVDTTCNALCITKEQLHASRTKLLEVPYVLPPGPISYMCDVAQVAILSALLNGGWLIGSTDSPFTFIKCNLFQPANNINDAICIDLNALWSSESKRNSVYQGLAFIALYIMALDDANLLPESVKSTPFEGKSVDGQPLHTYTFKIRQIRNGMDYTYLLGGVLLPNGLIYASDFKRVQEKLKALWSLYKTKESTGEEMIKIQQRGTKRNYYNTIGGSNTNESFESFPSSDVVNEVIDDPVFDWDTFSGFSGFSGVNKQNGGGRQYKIITERETKRKYVLVKKQKLYIENLRGRFRYANAQKKSIIFRKEP